ncbi:TetR/AcrR family transcriptional regulator [Micromonospora sp. 15K316]|uniref:TetR/AcrR family transcriptional regulator n=1 Tax=Micromonospora sp. 15K316 TaxID=2530376 RepID=UPI00352D6E1C
MTKAALYYHFKSKDEIVSSFVQDRLERIDSLVAWADAQPANRDTRRELIARYADAMFTDDHPSVMRFFEQNQTALKSLTAGQQMRGRMMQLASASAAATNPRRRSCARRSPSSPCTAAGSPYGRRTSPTRNAGRSPSRWPTNCSRGSASRSESAATPNHPTRVAGISGSPVRVMPRRRGTRVDHRAFPG